MNLKILILSIILLQQVAIVFAQEKADKVDLLEVVRETQKTRRNGEEISMLWWMPTEYWEAAFNENPNVSREDKDYLLGLLSKYTIIAAYYGEMEMGTAKINYVREEEIEQSIQIISVSGESFSPIPKQSLGMEISTILSNLRPVFGSLIGPMGQNMHFFVFQSEKTSDSIFNPFDDGIAKATLFSQKYEWRFPLGSLLKEKNCPTDGEKMNGAWKYCPRHGVKL